MDAFQCKARGHNVSAKIFAVGSVFLALGADDGGGGYSVIGVDNLDLGAVARIATARALLAPEGGLR